MHEKRLTSIENAYDSVCKYKLWWNGATNKVHCMPSNILSRVIASNGVQTTTILLMPPSSEYWIKFTYWLFLTCQCFLQTYLPLNAMVSRSPTSCIPSSIDARNKKNVPQSKQRTNEDRKVSRFGYPTPRNEVFQSRMLNKSAVVSAFWDHKGQFMRSVETNLKKRQAQHFRIQSMRYQWYVDAPVRLREMYLFPQVNNVSIQTIKLTEAQRLNFISKVIRAYFENVFV